MPRDRAWLITATAVVGGVGTLDAVVGSAVFSPLLLAGPLIASARLGGRPTSIIMLAAVLLAFLGGIPNGTFLSTNHLVRCTSILVAGAFAIWVAYDRTRREKALAHVNEVAQQAILGPVSAEVSGVQIAARCLSATDEARIGGDLYDVANTPFGARVLIGDVRGKGLDAVRLSSATISAFRRHAYTQPDLAALALLMDRWVHAEMSAEDFVTIVLAEFASGEVTLVNCGHHAPLVIGEDTRSLVPVQREPPLGLGPVPKCEHFPIRVGERLLFFTDGIVESRDRSGTTFCLEGSIEILRKPSLHNALDGLLDEVKAHTRDNLGDDLALLIAEPRAAITEN